MFHVTCDDIQPTVRKTIKLRKNASQKNIDRAIKQLTNLWEADSKSAPVLFVEQGQEVKNHPGTYYLIIGDQTCWGYSFGFCAWGSDQSMIDREIAGQKEYAYSK